MYLLWMPLWHQMLLRVKDWLFMWWVESKVCDSQHGGWWIVRKGYVSTSGGTCLNLRQLCIILSFQPSQCPGCGLTVVSASVSWVFGFYGLNCLQLISSSRLMKGVTLKYFYTTWDFGIIVPVTSCGNHILIILFEIRPRNHEYALHLWTGCYATCVHRALTYSALVESCTAIASQKTGCEPLNYLSICWLLWSWIDGVYMLMRKCMHSHDA